jgi:hypothetical protein
VQATDFARLLPTAVLSPTGPFPRTLSGKWDPAGASTGPGDATAASAPREESELDPPPERLVAAPYCSRRIETIEVSRRDRPGAHRAQTRPERLSAH